MNDVTIVIPQHGQSELTRACLQSLGEFESVRPRIIVVDDGSPDDSAALARGAVPEGGIVLEQPVQGITAAWNLGLAAAQTEFVILLNNDVLCRGPWIDALLAPLRNHTACLTGVEWRVELSLPPVVLERLGGQRFLAGWCLALRRQTWEQLGGFDESLRLYFSDTDIQGRLRSVAWRPADTSALLAVNGLPLTHLGHRTAHARTLASRCRSRWQSDRQRMLAKWNPTSTQCSPPPAVVR